jgi:hypothetical protein
MNRPSERICTGKQEPASKTIACTQLMLLIVVAAIILWHAAYIAMCAITKAIMSVTQIYTA